MAERGKKHEWRLQSIFDEALVRCVRCGLLGDMETVIGDRSMGWVGKPTYGCTPHSQEPRP